MAARLYMPSECPRRGNCTPCPHRGGGPLYATIGEAPRRTSRPNAQNPAARALADFPLRVTEIIRFAISIARATSTTRSSLTYFETGRVAIFRDPGLSIAVPGVDLRRRADRGQLPEGAALARHCRDLHRRRANRPHRRSNLAQVFSGEGVCMRRHRPHATIVSQQFGNEFENAARATPLPRDGDRRLRPAGN